MGGWLLEKNPLQHWQLKPTLVSHLAFQSGALQTELFPPLNSYVYHYQGEHSHRYTYTDTQVNTATDIHTQTHKDSYTPVGHGLDEDRSVLGQTSLASSLGGIVHSERVVAINTHSRHAIPWASGSYSKQFLLYLSFKMLKYSPTIPHNYDICTRLGIKN